MHGLKLHSYRLRCKSPTGLQGARPEGSTHGNCVICGRFMEELRDARCHTPECEDLLKKLCIDKGLALTVNEGADLWTILKTGALIQEREHWHQDDPIESQALDNHTCKCGRGLKMPKSDVCALCYRERNVAQMQNRRASKKHAKRKGKKIKNKIKGLDKIKLG